MTDRGVQLESWAPLGQGQHNLFEDPTLNAIATAYEKTVPQVILHWLIQRGIIVIPKSLKPERMRQNIDAFDFTLSEDEMARIATLDTGASPAFDHRAPASVSMLGKTRLT